MTNMTFHSLEKAISANRLSTYQSMFPSMNNQQVISNYIYNAKISENFYLLLQNLEVTLRNAIYDGYNNHSFPRPFFYLRVQNTTRAYNREYHSCACWKMIGTVKYHLQRNGITITDGKMIAELNFGFWTTLLEENHYKTLIWRRIFNDVFPYYPLTTSIDDAIDSISIEINKIRAFRNRIFHYEPIINRNDLDNVRSNIFNVLSWINPTMLQLTQLFDEYEFLKTEYTRINKLLPQLDNRNVLKKRKAKILKKRKK